MRCVSRSASRSPVGESAPGAPPAAGMVWVPGGDVRHGLRRPLPGGGAGPPGGGRRLLDGPVRGHQRRVPPLRRRHRARDRGRAARPTRRTTRAPTRAAGGRRRPCSASPGRAGRPARPVPLVGACPGRRLAPPARARRARSRGSTTTRSCTWPGTTSSPTRPGPARTCRPRPSGSAPRAAASRAPEFAWGDELTPGGRHMANVWQGEFPVHNRAADGYEYTAPVRLVPAQRLRACST